MERECLTMFRACKWLHRVLWLLAKVLIRYVASTMHQSYWYYETCWNGIVLHKRTQRRLKFQWWWSTESSNIDKRKVKSFAYLNTFRKPVILLENPRLLYTIILHSPYMQLDTLSIRCLLLVLANCVFSMCVTIHVSSYILDEDKHSITQVSQQKVC